MRTWPRYILMLLATALATLGLIAAVNLHVDSEAVYSLRGQEATVHEYVRKLLASRYGLTDILLQRMVKFEMAGEMNPDCAVTGSSRAMMASPGTMPLLKKQCRHFGNFAASGGSLEDMVIMLGALAGKPGLHHLYIGIDPWLRHNADPRWRQLKPAYDSARVRFGLEPETNDSARAAMLKLANLINARYFLRNVELLVNPITYQEVAQDMHNVPDDLPVRRPDGSFLYSQQHDREHIAAQVPSGILGYKIIQPYLEPKAASELHQVLSYFHKRGVKIHFLLTPYHPYMLQCRYANTCAAIRTVESYIRQEAPCLDADIIGGYDPAASGLGWQDFYDTMHVRPEALAKLAAHPSGGTCKPSGQLDGDVNERSKTVSQQKP